MSYQFHQCKNFIMNDALSDWFQKMQNKSSPFEEDKENLFQTEINKQKEEYHSIFLSYFKDRKIPLYESIENTQVRDIIKQKEKCVIYQGELYHSDYKIYVKPDLIIHKDIFLEIFNEVNIDDLPEYCIFDILYKIVNFSADKSDILNQGNIYYHKCKLFVANQCLYKSQKQGFFFAKEYRHKEKTLVKKQTIGHFNLSSDLKQSVSDAIRWLHKLNKYYDEWIIYPKPSCIELYPNLNTKNGSWNIEKKRLGELIKEITLVWNISYQQRCILLEKGITQWDDPLLISKIYPYKIKDNQRKMIQNKMITINSQNELKISPRKIKKKEFISILKNQENSIILDIESIIDLQEKETYFDDNINVEKPRICIIGTIINKEDYLFKDFTIKYCSNKEEKIIIQYWLSYLTKQFNGIIKVYHWGNAEKVYIDYMKKKYPDLNYPDFEMIDLLTHFKNEPITIKGCFGYGLKEIVNQLYNLELIENKWTDDTNGLDAMIQLMKTSEEAEIKNIPMKRFVEIKKLIYYNYMDCRVIVDILKMLEDMI